jgi:hypothetical protein
MIHTEEDHKKEIQLSIPEKLVVRTFSLLMGKSARFLPSISTIQFITKMFRNLLLSAFTLVIYQM